jgi:nicotinamidase-related amidase
MATIRDGNKTVLLVVDVQKGVMAEAWDAQRVVGNISRVVDRARAGGVPVIWVQHDDDELVRGSESWDLELAPAAGEPVVHKSFNSSFEQTDLEEELSRSGATRIALAGAATNWCIRATAYAALERGYDLTLISDAHTTGNLELGDGLTVNAEDIVTELNVVMQWVSYPGRTNGIATSDAIEFTT